MRIICYMYFLLPFLGLLKPVCGFAVPPANVWSRQRSSLAVRSVTGEEDAVYVSSDDDNVVDDAYLPSVAPSKVKASGVDDQTDLDNDSPPKAHPRRNTQGDGGGRGRGRGRGRGNGRGRGRDQQGRGPGRGRGGGRGRGRGRGGNSDSPALRAAKEINSEIVRAETPQEVLNAFTSRGGAKGLAGGGVFNSVNFSTCLHRLARVASAFNPDGAAAQAETRRGILADPRFALLFCSAAESIVGVDESISATASIKILEGADVEERVEQLINKNGGESPMRVQFKPREVSNVAWAIAKLNFSPPASVLPLIRSSEYSSGGDDSVQVMTKEDIILDLVTTSLKVRSQVLEVAKERSAIADPALKAKVKSRWIPTLSQLGAKVLDLIAAFGPDLYDSPASPQSGSFSSQEVANALYSFATAGRADSPFFDVLAKRHFEVTAEMKKIGQDARPQEYSNAIWGFATAGITSNRQREFVCYVASHFEDPDFVSQFKPQELSNTAWSCARLISKRPNGDDTIMEANDGSTVSFAEEEDAVLRILRIVASALKERVEEFKPQEISNVLWSCATVGFGSVETESHPSNGYIFLKSDRHEEDKAQVAHTLDIVSTSASLRMNRFRTQELNNLAWSYARLGHRGEASNEIYRGIGNEILRRSHQFDPQDIGTCLWAMASMEFFDNEVYMVAASRLNRRSAKLYKPQEMSMTCWALATANMKPKYLGAFDTTLVPAAKRPSLDDIGDDPITECFFTTTAEMMRRPQQFKEQEIKDVMWGLSRVGMRHPRLFKMFAEYLVGNGDSTTEDRGHGLRGFSSQGLANLAWSYAKQAQLASSAEYSRLKVGSQGRQAVHETICLDVGELQINRLFLRVAEEALHGPGGLDRFSAQDLANKCYSFAVLGLLHSEYFEGVGKIVSKRLSSAGNTKAASRKPSAISFKGQESANLLWAYATVNFPCDEMIDALCSHVVSLCSRRDHEYDGTAIANLFNSQELNNLGWSMAVLQRYPEGLVDIVYRGLYGYGASDDEVNRLRQNGVQAEHLMSSLYTQMALDMEAPHLGKLLPSDFPKGWTGSSNGGKSRGTKTKERQSDDSGSTSMLNLNSSRLQQYIGETLHRIGYDHVQEHTIGAEDIFSARNRQIDASSFPAEFLSIDIANIEEKIGIEVDGPAHFVTVLDDESDESGHVRSHSGRNKEGGKMISSAGNNGKVMWQFLSNGRRRVNGPTAFKHRLLGHLGWRIIHIPFWEWGELKGNEAAEEKYVRDLLDEV